LHVSPFLHYGGDHVATSDLVANKKATLMLYSTPNPTSLPTTEIEALAATAVWEIRERHTIAPGSAADMQIAAEATFLAACHLEDADRERLDADGGVVAIYPAGFWERVAAPFVTAVMEG
jgi:hypothetical protein